MAMAKILDLDCGPSWTEQNGLKAAANAAEGAGCIVLCLRNAQRVRIRRGLLAAVANPRTLVPPVVHERGDQDQDEGDQYRDPETHVISFVSGRRDASIGMAWREEWRLGSHLDEPTMVTIKADVLTAPMLKHDFS
jgi:hypothetical protein